MDSGTDPEGCIQAGVNETDEKLLHNENHRFTAETVIPGLRTGGLSSLPP